ncbi:type II toxin-antitoxin system HipA family toxin [Enterobacteriaceae bacterium C23F]
MEQLTVQAYLEERWQDIATLTFPAAGSGDWQRTEIHYLTDYAIEFLDSDECHAVSLNHPVSLFYDDDGQRGWMKWLDDIIPSGASRRYWIKALDLEGLNAAQQNFILLKFGTIAPVGNLRIKESLPERHPLAETLRFTLDDVKNRAADFLDYAQQRGAAAGGATGAGGEAPKLLLRHHDDNHIWIDSWQDESDNLDTWYLVKYPRGSRSEVDCNILRAEYHYYNELTAMGFNTIPTGKMRLEEGTYYPSLWLPRFDIRLNEHGKAERFAMESVYSILKKGPGTALEHEKTIRDLIQKITASHSVSERGFIFDVPEFVIEWVRRDLLNIIFGNSDNHGRNTAFIRSSNSIALAPVYDFAPMKADPEGIPRSMKWAQPLEIGGEYDFHAIAERLDDLVPATALLSALKQTARELITLEERLQARGVPQQIIAMPAIGFRYISEKLTRWGLL